MSITSHGARLASVPSWDWSAIPASVPGCSRPQQASLSLFGPPASIAELRSLPPLRRSLEHLDRFCPAGAPLQGTDLAAPITPEISLERLIPLVHNLAAWNPLPNVSRWVLHMIKRGYHIQFGAPWPRVIPTLVGPEQALVMEQEVDTLLRK